MKKIKSLFAIILCLVIVSASIPKKASAASDHLYLEDKTMYVKMLNNRKLFNNILNTKVSYSITNSNYNSNIKKSIPIYVYNQEKVDLIVGKSSFSSVGCELAACYNATVLFEDPIAVRERRKVNWLPYYIKIAEENCFTMSINETNVKPALKYLAEVYDNTTECVKDKLRLSFAGIDTIFSKLEKKFGNLSKFKNEAGFGTNPYKIPNILYAGGFVEASDPYTYKNLKASVETAITNKSFKVYIVSIWNHKTLNSCLEKGSGFHTICFYTKNGKLYSFNNIDHTNNKYKNSYDVSPETSFSDMIGESDTYIVGYCISKK